MRWMDVEDQQEQCQLRKERQEDIQIVEIRIPN